MQATSSLLLISVSIISALMQVKIRISLYHLGKGRNNTPLQPFDRQEMNVTPFVGLDAGFTVVRRVVSEEYIASIFTVEE
jgi:hypothetical protein